MRSILFVSLLGIMFLPLQRASARGKSEAQPAVDPREAEIGKAIDAVNAGRPGDAIALLEPVIASYDKEQERNKARYYCARSQVEILLYMGEAATEKAEAAAYGMTRCDALFLKGFVLVDLGKNDEAELALKKATELAPHNSQFLAELAELHKARHDWQGAYALFSRSASESEFSPPETQKQELVRARRGMGYTLTELGKIDEAEKLFRECLRLDPNDAIAKSELQHIALLKDRARK
jgi:tetratricopeptide (TPR) repeat protein